LKATSLNISSVAENICHFISGVDMITGSTDIKKVNLITIIQKGISVTHSVVKKNVQGV
jgi:hypothetical protein